MVVMKNKHLKSEIANLLETVDKAFGKDSVQYQNLDYYFDILVTVYEYNTTVKRFTRQIEGFNKQTL